MKEEIGINLPETNSFTKRQSALEYAWGQYKMCSNTANYLNKRLRNGRTLALIIIILTAFFGILSGQTSTWGRYYEPATLAFKWLSACLAIISTFISGQILTETLEKSQIKARAASEGIKSEIYKFLLQVGEYSSQSAEKILIKTNEITSKASDITMLIFNKVKEKEEMKSILKLDFTIEDYKTQRVENQIYDYYTKKGIKNQRIVRILRNVGLIISLSASLIGCIAVLNDFKYLTVWVAFCTSAGAAFASFLSANRYSFLASSYIYTANRLKMHLARWNTIDQTNKEEISNFVQHCEDELVRENQSWVLELSKKKVDSSFENDHKLNQK